jgi:hypothetical protein
VHLAKGPAANVLRAIRKRARPLAMRLQVLEIALVNLRSRIRHLAITVSPLILGKCALKNIAIRKIQNSMALALVVFPLTLKK